jgi:hypothetical protein
MPQPFKKAEGFRKVRVTVARAAVVRAIVNPAAAAVVLPVVMPAEGRPVPAAAQDQVAQAAAQDPAAPGPVAAARNKSNIAGGWTGDTITFASCMYYKVYIRSRSRTQKYSFLNIIAPSPLLFYLF